MPFATDVIHAKLVPRNGVLGYAKHLQNIKGLCRSKKLVPYVSRGGNLNPVLHFLMYNLKNRYHSTKSQSNEFIFREND